MIPGNRNLKYINNLTKGHLSQIHSEIQSTRESSQFILEVNKIYGKKWQFFKAQLLSFSPFICGD